MTDNEVAEIERIWELEASRNPKFCSYLSPGISVMKVFLERILREHKFVVLLINGDLESDLRLELTENVATKKLRFSDCVLLFNPNIGLILKQI